MAVLLAAAPVLQPEYQNAAAGRPDFLSVGLSLAAILPVVYGLTEIAAVAALGINALAYFVILGMLLLISQYPQLVLGLSSLRAGLWMLPVMAGLIGPSRPSTS